MRAILKSGKLLLGLLNDILDFSKVEAGKLELRPAVLDVASLLAEVRRASSRSRPPARDSPSR